MATVKVILRIDKKNKQGECPLFLRVTKFRRKQMVSLKIYLKEKEWNKTLCQVKKSHPNSVRLNAFISKKKANAEAEIVTAETKNQTVDSKSLMSKIKGGDRTDFFIFAQRHLDTLKYGKQIGSYRKAKSVIEKLKAYYKSEILFIDEVSYTFLKDYNDYLRDTLKNNSTTVHSNFKVIHTILNEAVSEGLLSRDNHPFVKFKIKAGTTTRAYLIDEEIKAIATLDLESKPKMKIPRDMFIFACYAGGVRISDLLQLRWRDIYEGRMNIQTKKTGSLQVVKLTEKANMILESYKNTTTKETDFVFPYISSEKEIDTPDKLHDMISKKTALVNKYLKEIAEKAEISKHVSFHVSRHTFATSALRKGVRIEYVSKLMGHSNIKETQIYAKVINEELDKAMDVFND